jgi:ADP-ribose pyrophosphatase
MNTENRRLIWKQLEKRIVFKDEFIGVRKDLVELPDASTTKFTVVESKEFVLVLCHKEEDEFILVNQFRYPWMQTSLEFVAGFIDSGETPEKSARREVEEETGYLVQTIAPLLHFHPTTIVSGHIGYLFYATIEEGGKLNRDPVEFIEVKSYSSVEIDRLIKDKRIIHGPSLLAWFAAKAYGYV